MIEGKFEMRDYAKNLIRYAREAMMYRLVQEITSGNLMGNGKGGTGNVLQPVRQYL
jgi:hypothetical protein